MVNNRLENKMIDNQKINAFNIFIPPHREDIFGCFNHRLNNLVQSQLKLIRVQREFLLFI